MNSTSLYRLENLTRHLNLQPKNITTTHKTNMKVPSLSSHILDTSKGKPAPNVLVTLEKNVNGEFQVLATAKTNDDGRVTKGMWYSKNGTKLEELSKQEANKELVLYRITFETGAYFKRFGEKSLYPFVQIVFEMNEAEHYHIPLLLSPYGYSTYRGS